MSTVRTTRKIQLQIQGNDEEKKNAYNKIFQWNEIVFRAANQVASHLYFQNKVVEFSYLADSVKLLLIDQNTPKDKVTSSKARTLLEQGAIPMLNTSRQNSTYRVLSEIYKGKMPSDVFNNINSIVGRNFESESESYYNGLRSLRTYKKGFPIPFSVRSIKGLDLSTDGKDYIFTLFGIKFKTKLGKDTSKNKELIDQAIKGTIKLCNSSIQIIKKKVLLLAVFEQSANPVEGPNEIRAELSESCVFIAKFGELQFRIGEKQSYLYEKHKIAQSMTRVKESMDHKSGGKGKKYKTRSIERMQEKLRNYGNTKFHTYTKALIDLCIKYNCGKLKLIEFEAISTKTQRLLPDNPNVPLKEMLIPSWSYGGVLEKLEYKCNKLGINLVLETSTT